MQQILPGRLRGHGIGPESGLETPYLPGGCHAASVRYEDTNSIAVPALARKEEAFVAQALLDERQRGR